ncbi:TlpA family protein disulfide reductase [Halioxenophilus aromaticivorans]|uniref:TlpA disulfide reductase family protein n=1 Tax=Halioxenophilus aromaticivorans TaxID=1306992 RepID=A0AAV3U204_9ALTE
MNASCTKTLALLLTLMAWTAQAAMPPQSGDKAPDWILTNAEGKPTSLYRDSDDAQVVLVFWASWCPFCLDLMPQLEALQTELAEKPVKFFALNVWEDGDPVQYLATKAPHLRLLLKAETVAQRYGVVGTPGLFVMDEEKNITYIRQRGTSSEEAITAVRTALGY